MLRYLIILLLIAFFSNQGKPQSSFQVTFRSPLNEYFTSMIEDKNGNYLAVGQQRYYNQFETNKGVVWRISHNGDTLSKVFSFGDTASVFNQILLNNDCYCTIIGGLTLAPDFNTSYILILDLDTNLNIVNQKVIQPFPYKGAGFSRMIQSNTAIYGLGEAIDQNDIVNPSIIKLNNEFNLVGVQTYPFYNGTGVFSGEFVDAIFSSDSSQIWTFPRKFSPDNSSYYDLMIVDTSLNFISIKEFPYGLYPYFGDFDNSLSVKWITDSTFLIGGDYWHQYYPAPSQFDIGFAEFDSSMVSAPIHTFGAVDTMDYAGFINTFTFVNSDSIYFTGTKRLVAGFFPEKVSWIYAGMFNRNYQLYYERFYGGDAHYWVEGILRTSDGGSLISALRYDFNTQNDERDVFFLKLTPEGLITSKRENKQCPYLPFAIYPNPGSDILHLDLVISEAQFALFNLNGLALKTLLIKEGENHINCSDLTQGYYLVKVTNPSGEVFTQKWIKQ